MTWQVEHTIPFVDDGTYFEQQTAALKYFFDTWLPSKGWTVSFRDGEDETSRYRIFQRDFTDLFTGQPEKHYLWTDLNSKIQYEDSTYTAVPGDKGTDTTNSVAFTWHSTTDEYGSHSYKFWGSTENSKAFLVTRWNRILSWDLGNDWPTYKPHAGISTGPSVDRWDSCIWLPMQNTNGTSTTMYHTNLPNNTNISNTESPMYMGPQESKDCLGSTMAFWDTVELCQSDSAAKATIKRDDIKWFNGNVGTSSVTHISAYMRTFMVVQVNGGDYWLFTKDSQQDSQICLGIGPTIPDFE